MQQQRQEHPQRRQTAATLHLWLYTALCVVIVVCFNVYDRMHYHSNRKTPRNCEQHRKIKQRMKTVPGTEMQEQSKKSKTGSAQDRVIPKETMSRRQDVNMMGGMGVTDKTFIQRKIKEMPL